MASVSSLWPQSDPPKPQKLLFVRVAKSVDEVFDILWLNSQVSVALHAKRNDSNFLESRWYSSREQLPEPAYAWATGPTDAQQKPAVATLRYRRARFESAPSALASKPFQNDETQQLTTVMPGQRYVIEAFNTTTAPYGDKFKVWLRHYIVPSGPNSTLMLIEFGAEFLPSMNRLMKPVIGKAIEGGVRGTFKIFRQCLADVVELEDVRDDDASLEAGVKSDLPAAAAAAAASDQAASAAPATPGKTHVQGPASPPQMLPPPVAIRSPPQGGALNGVFGFVSDQLISHDQVTQLSELIGTSIRSMHQINILARVAALLLTLTILHCTVAFTRSLRSACASAAPLLRTLLCWPLYVVHLPDSTTEVLSSLALVGLVNLAVVRAIKAAVAYMVYHTQRGSAGAASGSFGGVQHSDAPPSEQVSAVDPSVATVAERASLLSLARVGPTHSAVMPGSAGGEKEVTEAGVKGSVGMAGGSFPKARRSAPPARPHAFPPPPPLVRNPVSPITVEMANIASRRKAAPAPATAVPNAAPPPALSAVAASPGASPPKPTALSVLERSPMAVGAVAPALPLKPSAAAVLKPQSPKPQTLTPTPSVTNATSSVATSSPATAISSATASATAGASAAAASKTPGTPFTNSAVSGGGSSSAAAAALSGGGSSTVGPAPPALSRIRLAGSASSGSLSTPLPTPGHDGAGYSDAGKASMAAAAMLAAGFKKEVTNLFSKEGLDNMAETWKRACPAWSHHRPPSAVPSRHRVAHPLRAQHAPPLALDADPIPRHPAMPPAPCPHPTNHLPSQHAPLPTAGLTSGFGGLFNPKGSGEQEPLPGGGHSPRKDPPLATPSRDPHAAAATHMEMAYTFSSPSAAAQGKDTPSTSATTTTLPTRPSPPVRRSPTAAAATTTGLPTTSATTTTTTTSTTTPPPCRCRCRCRPTPPPPPEKPPHHAARLSHSSMPSQQAPHSSSSGGSGGNPPSQPPFQALQRLPQGHHAQPDPHTVALSTQSMSVPHSAYPPLHAASVAAWNTHAQPMVVVVDGGDGEEEDTRVVVEEEVFENERFQPFRGWGSLWPGHFLPSDRIGRFGDRQGKPGGADSMLFERIAPLLPPGWKWAEENWEIDMDGYDTEAVDAEGWTYALDFSYLRHPPPMQSGKCSVKDFVRRRRLFRTRVRALPLHDTCEEPAHEPDDHSTSEEEADGMYVDGIMGEDVQSAALDPNRVSINGMVDDHFASQSPEAHDHDMGAHSASYGTVPFTHSTALPSSSHSTVPSNSTTTRTLVTQSGSSGEHAATQSTAPSTSTATAYNYATQSSEDQVAPPSTVRSTVTTSATLAQNVAAQSLAAQSLDDHFADPFAVDQCATDHLATQSVGHFTTQSIERFVRQSTAASTSSTAAGNVLASQSSGEPAAAAQHSFVPTVRSTSTSASTKRDPELRVLYEAPAWDLSMVSDSEDGGHRRSPACSRPPHHAWVLPALAAAVKSVVACKAEPEGGEAEQPSRHSPVHGAAFPTPCSVAACDPDSEVARWVAGGHGATLNWQYDTDVLPADPALEPKFLGHFSGPSPSSATNQAAAGGQTSTAGGSRTATAAAAAAGRPFNSNSPFVSSSINTAIPRTPSDALPMGAGALRQSQPPPTSAPPSSTHAQPSYSTPATAPAPAAMYPIPTSFNQSAAAAAAAAPPGPFQSNHQQRPPLPQPPFDRTDTGAAQQRVRSPDSAQRMRDPLGATAPDSDGEGGEGGGATRAPRQRLARPTQDPSGSDDDDLDSVGSFHGASHSNTGVWPSPLLNRSRARAARSSQGGERASLEQQATSPGGGQGGDGDGALAAAVCGAMGELSGQENMPGAGSGGSASGTAVAAAGRPSYSVPARPAASPHPVSLAVSAIAHEAASQPAESWHATDVASRVSHHVAYTGPAAGTHASVEAGPAHASSSSSGGGGGGGSMHGGSTDPTRPRQHASGAARMSGDDLLQRATQKLQHGIAAGHLSHTSTPTSAPPPPSTFQSGAAESSGTNMHAAQQQQQQQQQLAPLDPQQQVHGSSSTWLYTAPQTQQRTRMPLAASAMHPSLLRPATAYFPLAPPEASGSPSGTPGAGVPAAAGLPMMARPPNARGPSVAETSAAMAGKPRSAERQPGCTP
ncbi:MAG: hypothetical protein WDW38_000793 [Sanguina aurantia]